jgi:hypothetical protein
MRGFRGEEFLCSDYNEGDWLKADSAPSPLDSVELMLTQQRFHWYVMT